MGGDHKTIAEKMSSVELLRGSKLSVWLEVAWSHQLAKTKDYDLIIAATDHVLQWSEDDAEIQSALKLQPLAKSGKGETLNAIWMNARALDIYPNDGEQWNTLANLYIRIKEYAKGLESAVNAFFLAQEGYFREGSLVYLRHKGHALRASAICFKEINKIDDALRFILNEAQKSYELSEDGSWKATTHIAGLEKLRRDWGLV